jgi:hypothetical protein
MVAEHGILRGITRSLATVVLGAGIRRRSSLDVPLIRPIAINISALARSSFADLTILAPHTILALCIGET